MLLARKLEVAFPQRVTECQRSGQRLQWMSLPVWHPFIDVLGRLTMIRSIVRAATTLAIAVVAAVPAQAQYTFVPTRAGIGGTGLIDWATLGSAYTNVANGTSGIAINTTALTATVTQAGAGSLQRRDQGIGWSGNFTTPSSLLWTNGNNGPMTIMFSGAVGAAGAAFQANTFGAFTGSIEALDASQNVLATFVFNGMSTSNGDGSAPFAGISSTLNDIWGVRFTGVAQSNTSNDFAIDNLAVNIGSEVVPEPSTYALMGTGLIGLVGVARRKRSV
jgi:PEP-CTERM motif